LSRNEKDEIPIRFGHSKCLLEHEGTKFVFHQLKIDIFLGEHDYEFPLSRLGIY